MRWMSAAALAMVIAAAVMPAAAQVSLPGVTLPRLPPQVPALDRTLRTAEAIPQAALRQLRVRDLLREHPRLLEADPAGYPIVRGQVGALSPSADALQRAAQAGFTVVSDEMLAGIGLQLVVLRVPDGMSTRRALRRLRALDPDGSYDFNHVYTESGVAAEAAQPAAPGPAALQPRGAGPRVGLIDSGVDAAHPALAHVAIQRFGCEGRSLPAPHGTATASLLVGEAGGFHGALPDATLYAADIYCGQPTGGNIALLAIALDWMARERIAVVNISLVGPKSALLTSLVRAMVGRGHLLVAAVGNDGPAAPPLYPAAYPGVIGVTGVDANERALPEACRGSHVALAAPGADMIAAGSNGGWATVRGTSFATPLVAGLLARGFPEPDPALAAAALERLVAVAVDLGPKGEDPTYGKGLVGAALRVAPAAAATAREM